MADDMDYLECIRFLFAEQDTMTDDMEDYLEDIRFLFDAEDTTMDTDDYLEDVRFLFDDKDTTAAGDAKGAKWVKDVAQKLKKMKKGVKKFFGRLGETVRRGFCCCVSVEERFSKESVRQRKTELKRMQLVVWT
ncbi:hypothetical protein AGOR_G00123160 [Albula goreensis]|uniref:Uncharacterized protein n=1 Tax=Albula goreensis TaxID=1534307 RepID=A0A8T3DBA5_9TELE|nr:hypothetical protein AGOR_G00123160 [Albula goreensis]